ncbi:hypothetical protein BDV28DRAFT_144869 [Aspergillus coremiiformis]|uniref:Uncharacterized protein n=1 Tax=Aspergillus coremiiformis TaxID=138285 RepID=A0A5N6ZHB1_9EURO|nr:hypothetical protein BDV28DRAFT_144869 [Aspergillus coremiiformis]
MDDQFLPENRLRWTHGRPKRPIWPTEPRLESIRFLAFSILHRHFPNLANEHLLDVQLLSEKITKKLFILSHPQLTKKYIFQVLLPVDPFFLMENEVATLSFVHHRTSIPVPPLIAWDSSSDNLLGYEWSMVEMLDGVPLGTLWPQMSLEEKLRLAEELAHIFAQLWSQKFDRIGSLYIEERSLEAVQSCADDSNIFQTCFEDLPSPTFRIGPMVSMPFFVGRRCFLPSNRGPFSSSKSWMKAQIRLELEYVITGQEILQLSPELSPEDINLKSSFIETLDEFQDVCQDYFRALPSVFSSDEERCFSLCHHGLNEENILLDPDTYKIVGILDWDMTSVLPDWLVQEYFQTFHGLPPEDMSNPPSGLQPGLDREFQKWNVFPKRLPDLEAADELQQRADETLRRLGVPVQTNPASEEKKHFYIGVLHLGNVWELAQQYLRGLPHFQKEYQQFGWSSGLDDPISDSE